ncbi:MAG TPA: phosphatase RsbU N-terminal domain-containing protein [Prosthecobacter sp.]|nr:phosphatase RsbU N-terminal domain-containing protein [Prosthecobacter sp.]
MKVTKRGLTEQYLKALRSHLEHGSRAKLLPAHQLGEQAVMGGLDTLDLAKIHNRALATLLSNLGSIKKGKAMTARATDFFTEAVMPIENTHRAARKAGAQLLRINAKLGQRSLELAESRRELRRGIASRKAVERLLLNSEAESAGLIAETHRLREEFQSKAHQAIDEQEEVRRRMRVHLQDEVAQTLLAFHMRLVALDKRHSVSAEACEKEMAITQEVVQESMRTIQCFDHQFGIHYED